MNFDLLIRGALVVDGTGRQAHVADLGVRDGIIEAVGVLEGAQADQVVEAAGRCLTPGFIDPHIHSEIALLGGPHRYGALLQGVTTHLMAPDGFGWAQLSPDLAQEMWAYTLFSHGEADIQKHWPTVDDFLATFVGRTPANVVPQVPHGAIRLAAMGWQSRPANDAEINQMGQLTREWMEAGAVGLCAGLDYQPGAFSDFRELVALNRVVREYDGVYAAHLRYNVLGREAAWREMMAVGQESGVRVHVSHESVSDVTEALLAESESICDLTFESYLYQAGCTHLALMLPMWAQEGGSAGLRARLKEPQVRHRIREEMQERMTGPAFTKHVFAVTQTGRYIGKSFRQVAADEGLSEGDLALRILEEEEPYALMVSHKSPADPLEEMVRRTISHPEMMVGSDGVYHGPHGHPRGYGCYARILRLAVRELEAASLEEAVHKMSGFVASRFRIIDRGTLERGKAADLVLFDPHTVSDRSTWEHPWLAPAGIAQVYVNGELVVESGRPTDALPGRVVRAGSRV
jgi:N-acyl-D-amino-acid deacylase